MRTKTSFIFLLVIMMGITLNCLAYDNRALEKDFKATVELGDKIYKATVQTSQILSSGLLKDGKPVATFNADALEKLEKDLKTQSQEKIRPDINQQILKQIMEQKIWGYDKSPVDISSHQSQSARHRSRKDQNLVNTSKILDKNARMNDPKAVKDAIAKVVPENKTIESNLVKLDRVSVTPIRLEKESADFRLMCVDLFTKLALKERNTQRAHFVSLITSPAYKSNRHHLIGVVNLLVGIPELRETAEVKMLIPLAKELSEEAAIAAKAINFDFGAAIRQMPKAYNGLRNYSQKHRETLKRSMTSPGAMKRSGSKSGHGKLKVNYLSESITHVWEDMADHLQQNFDNGAQIGEAAGMYIGTVDAVNQAYGQMSTIANTIHTVGVFGNNALLGQIGMAPDAYAVVGHYAGGAIGTFGGIVGTAAGWFCGTVESYWANRGPKRPDRHENHRKSGGASAAATEVTLF